MSDHHEEQPLLPWVGLIVASMATIVVAVAIVRGLTTTPALTATEQGTSVMGVTESRLPSRGVRAIIRSGDLEIARTLPSLAFTVGPGQSLSPAIPAGPFSGTFEVSFTPGLVREAELGARIQGGSLIVLRDGEPILESYAGETARVVLSRLPETMSSGLQTFTYEFESDPDVETSSLRALWKPFESDVPLPLPSSGAPLVEPGVMRGEVLAQTFNCVACHQSGSTTRQAALQRGAGPVLGHVGARVRPGWLRRWLQDPHAVVPHATMPDLLHGRPDREQIIDDLTHYLASLGGAADVTNATPDAQLVATGHRAYHEIGCFACHGPMTSDGVPAADQLLRRDYTWLVGLNGKTTPAQLTAYLLDPLAVHPDGQMPSMDLSEIEAAALTAYLLHGAGEDTSLDSDREFTVDRARADRGAEHFASLGCVQCHDLGPDRTAVAWSGTAPALETLSASDADRGCLAATPGAGIPKYALTDDDRADLGLWLASLDARRCDDVPIDQMAMSLSRLRCTSCHEAYAETGPEPALLTHFTTRGEADLGDEGRLPPSLTDVASRLDRPWLRRVLEDDARARPWMAVRMPVFGPRAMAGMTDGMTAAAGVTTTTDEAPGFTQDLATVGRHLVGDQGLNCIQCHDIAGRPSTGTPGPDLALATERLRYDGFSRWLHNPANVRPGTRMPTFFVNGYSGLTQYLGGHAQDQIDAIWCYLSQGEHLPLPDGLVDPAGLEIVVTDEPVVFRTFMEHAGVRAIAVGFPSQVHYAFDAATCRLASAWTGQFLNASGAWAARGGAETNPEQFSWTGPAEPLLTAPSDAAVDAQYRFRGYRLDEARRPTFRYEVSLGDQVVTVSDKTIPVGSAASPRLQRRLELSGPPGLRLVLNPSGHIDVSAKPDGTSRGDGRLEITLDDAGTAVIDLEVTW